ncbi:MAG TPA: DUF2336 domain-containing protein [Pseudolabrys sp.]|nr:DUF2336 domain-containing protein [Pseudolabrys sp.]
MVQSNACSPLDSLVDLACRDGVDVRPTLLRVVTDLYVQKPSHTPEEERQYVELALGLIGAVDQPTRAAVTARLESYARAPRAVLERLTTPAEAVPATPDAARPEPAMPQPQAPHLELEPERQLEPQLEQPRPQAAAMAAPAPALSHDLIELFFSADPDERRLILLNLDYVATPVPYGPPPAADAVIRRLETTALQRNAAEFARMLQRGLSVSHELAVRLVHDASGEGIVVAAKSLGMKADVLQRILLFLNPAVGQSVERVFELAQLYDDISWHAAECMVEIWRQTAARIRPRQHAPVLWDDERSNARARATPALHRGPRPADAPRPLPRTGSKPVRLS